MNSLVQIVCVLALGMFAAAESPAAEEIRDVRGASVSFSQAPKRVISLSPAITEMVFALGAGKTMVGNTTFCNYPPEAAKVAKIGDVTTNIEAVLALKPDLVLAHHTMNAQAVAQLAKLRVKTFCVGPESFAQLEEQMTLLGRVLGRDKEAARWRKQFQQRLAALVKRLRDSPKVTCALVVQANPLWVAGRDSFLDEIVSLGGGVNICAKEFRISAPLDGERLVAINPTVILGISPKNAALKRGFWKQLEAVKRGRVYDLPQDLISRPGPRMLQAAEMIAKLLDAHRR